MHTIARIPSHAHVVKITTSRLPCIAEVTRKRWRRTRASTAEAKPHISGVKVTITAAPISIGISPKGSGRIPEIAMVPEVTISVPAANITVPVAKVAPGREAAATTTEGCTPWMINQGLGAPGGRPGEIRRRSIIGAARTGGRTTVAEALGGAVARIEGRWRRKTRRHDQVMLEQVSTVDLQT